MCGSVCGCMLQSHEFQIDFWLSEVFLTEGFVAPFLLTDLYLLSSILISFFQEMNLKTRRLAIMQILFEFIHLEILCNYHVTAD